MHAKKIVIIGSGIGGLATANLLAHAGHEVTILEKNGSPGGRAGQKIRDGFTFDTGPSWYLMPQVFEHYYELLEEPLANWLTLQRLTPAYKVFFDTHTPIVVTGNLETDAATFEQIEPHAGSALKAYVSQSEMIYRLSLDHFLYSNFERLSDFFHRAIIRKLFVLPKLLLQPIHAYVTSFVKDKRLQQILEYPMVFLGTSPFSAPSMYSLMSALDFNEGVFYPQGGMYTIIESLVAIGKQKGISYRFNTPVTKILTDRGNAIGVTLESGEHIVADIVIANADLHFTETQLLAEEDQSYPESYWNKKETGPSAILMYLGLNKRLPELEHHNLLFVDEWKENFSAIYDSKTIPDRASIYISKTSHTDPTVAPAGSENIFVLVPLPSGIELSPTDLEELSDHYLTQIESMTHVSIRDAIVVKELFGPNDFKTQYHSWRSSMLGQSHLLKQSAFFRTANKSKKIKNLYYVGGNTTPGIGLPMCLIGAELVYKRIIGNKKGGRVAKLQKADRS